MIERKKDVIAQWAYDGRPVLGRFHLWLKDVDVEWEKGVRAPDYTFAPRGIRRQLALASAVTALGTKLYGGFGDAIGADKLERNRIKKDADALSAYTLSEALWYLTRSLPENHAIMVCLGEGLMPKAGETQLMGANPMLGFGRVYARPEVAKFVDRHVRRLLNEPGRTWDDFYSAIRARGITIWGAAIDTLENTTRFATGETTGPMSVLHLFDQPLVATRPYESYMGSLTVPKDVADAAAENSVLLDVSTPRARVMEAIELAYPGIRRENVHVWTLRGGTRARRLSGIWGEWAALGVHQVEEGWITPKGVASFSDSGTYAPTYMVEAWTDDDGERHVFLCDGYAASAEALQAASLSEALDVDVTMCLCSPSFELGLEEEWRVMRIHPEDPEFVQKAAAAIGDTGAEPERVEHFREAIREARRCNFPVGFRVVRASDFFPEKRWRVLATSGYMCDDPYTGTDGVTRIGEDTYRVTTRLVTRQVSIRIAFDLQLMEGHEKTRLIFSPLLTRFASGSDWTTRAVRVSDSGRIRNELQTMMGTALEYEGERMKVFFDRIDNEVMSPEKKLIIRAALTWYSEQHPVWFDWLEVH